jgi:hypothetical protein
MVKVELRQVEADTVRLGDGFFGTWIELYPITSLMALLDICKVNP